MRTNTQFIQTFNRLLPMGMHMVATYVDKTGLLQVSEISGGYVEPGENEEVLLQLFVSSKNAPSFFEGLDAKLRLAVVLCSPQSFETHQVKGRIEGVRDFHVEEFSIYESWQENYFESIKSIGVSDSILQEVVYEPTHSIQLRVTDVFTQTPALGTGVKW
jgi:hypothetical protein